MVQHVFRARVWEHSPGDPGSWHFVTVPAELSEDLVLPVKKQVRHGEGLVAGSSCEVTLDVI